MDEVIQRERDLRDLRTERAEVNQLLGRLRAVEAERNAYRKALWRIGSSESGHWGTIARDVLAEQGATHA